MNRFLSQKSLLASGIIASLLGFQLRAAAQGVSLAAPAPTAGPAPTAAPAPEKTRLDFRAPAECLDAEAFKALIGSRVPAGWEAAPEELARRIDVTIAHVDDHYVATLELVDERGVRVARAVSGKLCSDAMDGIALVAALAIQARAEDAADVTARAIEPVPVQPTIAPAPAPSARAAAPPVTPPAASPVERARDEPRVGWRVSARAALTTGLGLTAAPGAGLGVVYERGSARLGLALQGFWTGRVEASGVPVRFRLLAARLEGCPFVLALARWASLEPCPFAEVGSVTGEAFVAPPAVFRGFPGSALWASIGGAGRVVGQFGALAIELEALFGVPLLRERFYVEGGSRLYRLPALHAGAAAGLGVRF